MPTYRVRQDLDAYRPARWEGTDYERRFGPHNEGFTLDAPSLDDARSMLRSGEAGQRLNPGLLTIEPEPGPEPEQVDLTGRPVPTQPIPAAPSDPEPGPEPLQLALDVDVPVAVRLPRGLGIALQPPLTAGGS